MRTVLRYLKPQAGRICLQLSIKMAGTVAELFLPSLLSIILDTCAPAGDLRGVWMLGMAMVLCALMAWLGNVTANRMSTNITRRFTYRLRTDLFRRTTALSAAQQDQVTDASLVSRLSTDTYYVHNMVDKMQRLGVRAPILLLGGILVSLSLDTVLTLVLLATLPLLALTVIISSRKGVPLFTRVQEGQDTMVRRVQENMTGARVIRALSRTQHERDSFEEVNGDLASRQRRADMTMAAVSPIVNLVLNTGLALVVLVGAWRVHTGAAMPGTIIAFLSYFTIILNAMLSISRLFVMYSKGSASARRIEEILGMPEDLLPQEAAGEDTSAHVAFRDVSFSYNKNIDNVSHLSFSVEHGQTLGIIGPTGSGKSTLLALLMRQYDPDSGVILLDGQPLASLTPEQLHDRLGVVFQNDFLMADTIREN
ncbi:MAG: ABC transporter ATP-binding protein, partial [Aristaeellaceae bacterium]